MSRSCYSDDCDGWDLIRWRGQVASAIRGKRGQNFLRELLAALDALPARRLIRDDLERNGEVCALGSVGRARGIDMTQLDPYEYEELAATFGIAHQLVREIEYENDLFQADACERRFEYVREWVASQIIVKPEELIEAGEEG